MSRPLVAALALCLIVGPAAAQVQLTARQSQALTCAAMLHLGASQLGKLGHISASDERVLKQQAMEVLEELPVSRSARTQAMNAKIQEIARGKTTRQIVQEFEKIYAGCRRDFLS